MIEYVVETNPDNRTLQRIANVLERGGVVAFPTETNWVVAANPFDQSAVNRLYQLRHIEDSKHLTMMVPNFQKAMEIAYIDDGAFSLLKRVIPGSYTFIFEAQKKLTKYLKASKIDHQVGIRFPVRNLCQKILSYHGEVLITTHITHDMVENSDEGIPLYSAQIEDQFGGLIDLIIDPGEFEFLGSTTIVDFTAGTPVVQRVGIGKPDLFL